MHVMGWIGQRSKKGGGMWREAGCAALAERGAEALRARARCLPPCLTRKRGPAQWRAEAAASTSEG